MPFAQRPVRDRYTALRDLVFVHAGSNERACQLAELGDGIVLHGSRGFAVARTWRHDAPLLLDPERYVEDRNRPGHVPMFLETAEEAVQAQRDAGVACLLAPSRFPQERTVADLRATMEAGQAFVDAARHVAPDLPAFVTIVVRYDELASRTWTKIVADAELPVAPVFAGYADPLSASDCLAGAVELIGAAPAALPLRCDMSVAGFVASGAVAGAIGASSSVRHLYLPRRVSKPATVRRASLFVPRFANWIRADYVEAAQADPGLDDLFRCQCVVCGPRGDVRMLVGPSADASLRDNHSIAAAVSLTRTVVAASDPLGAWRAVCMRSTPTKLSQVAGSSGRRTVTLRPG
jgi:hypothetical protein